MSYLDLLSDSGHSKHFTVTVKLQTGDNGTGDQVPIVQRSQLLEARELSESMQVISKLMESVCG